MLVSLRRLVTFAFAALLWIPAGLPGARAQPLPNDPSACQGIARDTVNLQGPVKTWRDTTLANAEATGDFRPLLNPDSIRVPVGKGTGDAGLWTPTPSGGRVWCLEIKSSTYKGNAKSGTLGLVFGTFDLPSDPAAELIVYDDAQEYNGNYDTVLGPYDAGDNAPQGFITDEVCFKSCPTTEEKRRSLIVAYYEPPGTSSTFSIPEVIHGFDQNGFRNQPGASASCHINASLSAPCDRSRPWSSEIRATVQLIGVSVAGVRNLKTGFLINNTAEDLTPYLLFANHSIPSSLKQNGSLSGGNVDVLRFNYQSTACGTGTVTEEPSYYVLEADQTQIHVYESFPYDFALLELPSDIPQSFKVFYAGWSREGTLPQEGTVIGHPLGDVKKISFGRSIVEYSNTRWRADFDGNNDGAIQHANSGSPFLDENRHVVGHVSTYIGNLGCDASGIRFPKFSENWNQGLSPFLDPGATNRMTLPPVAGYDLNVANETFADSTEDLASGFFRTAGRIDVGNVTVQSGSRLLLRAREGIRIEGPFLAEAGSDFEALIDEGPTLTGLGIPETYDDLPISVPMVTGGGQGQGQQSDAAGGASNATSPSAMASKSNVPAEVTLSPNYPNPFRRQTILRYGLPEDAHVRLVVYDVLGRKVNVVVDAQQRAGYHRLTWKAGVLPSGTYLYRLEAGGTFKNGTMTVVQ